MKNQIQKPMLQRPLFWIVLFIGLGIRLYFVIAHYGNFDTESYYIVADLVRSGENVYANTARYNYTPIWYTILGLMSLLSDWVHVPLHMLVRILLTFIDLCSAFLVMKIGERFYAKPIVSFILYWLNPGIIIIVAYHGQFEVLALLPILLVLANLIKTPKWIFIAGASAIIIKHNVVFIVWMIFVRLFGWRKAIFYMIITALLFLLTFIPALPEGIEGIRDNVLLYSSMKEYGFGIFLPSIITRLLFFSVMLGLPIIAVRFHLNIEQSAAYSALAFFAFAYGMGIQYFILLLILVAYLPRQRFFWILISCIVSFYYTGLFPLHKLQVFVILWLFSLIWFFYFLQIAQRTRLRAEEKYI